MSDRFRFDPGLVKAVSRALSIDCASGPENASLFTEQAEVALAAAAAYRELNAPPPDSPLSEDEQRAYEKARESIVEAQR